MAGVRRGGGADRVDAQLLGELLHGRGQYLALANRGIAALEEVGVMESVRSALIPMAGRMLHDEEGRLRLIPYGNKPHEVIYSVSRGGLNTLLVDAAEATGKVSIRFGETVYGRKASGEGLKPGMITDAKDTRAITAFIAWTADSSPITPETRMNGMSSPVVRKIRSASTPVKPGIM